MKKIVIALMSVVILSCSSSDSGSSDTTSLNLVTGINFRQNADDASFGLGNPNILVNNKFVIYPNPANDVVMITSEQNVTDVWIVPGNAKKIHQDVSFNTILNNNLYSEEALVSKADFAVNGQSSESLGLNISQLQKGYYRVFVKIGGQIYWDNLYKNGSNGGSEAEIATLINFWN